jgi:hypothetical protein
MKKARLPLVIVLSFLLSACSSSFVYNNIDWLLYWYLGDYVDLSLDQKAVLDERVVAWQSWHRSAELEKYQAQLKRLRVKFASGALSEEQWLSEFEEAQQHLHRFRSKIAPELAGIVQQLSTAQVEGMLSAWSKKRQERQSEFEKRTETERLIRQKERLTKFVEDNVGELTKLQSSIINTYAAKFLSTTNERTAYHTSLQHVIRDVFANRDKFEFERQLADLIRHPDQYKTSQYQALLDHNARLYARMLAELSNTFTQKQKITLDNKLEEGINVIEALISD